ncbi:PREDICTED: transcription factor bHLH157-like isoform X2 [Tarenaya hassleriana]|uniref:transcription factor bHLH157-like isoform X2 n=1 Tax=Tarenaya hassleriana TaxID=28532 RepID=UPI00053C7EC0|nr:PREDICTED: transcription factor bHLH157-like isoform X2 [Tarenaya hassleriana]
MGSELKHMLKSLCCSHGWSYAVFWRYDHINSMLLTMGDAYHDEQFRTAVDDMLLQVHIFGEGIIGEAALTGNHRWMSRDTADDIFQVENELQTVLVVPVGSRGVAQFGSTRKIQESPEILEETTTALELAMDHVSAASPPRSSDLETLDLDSLFASLVPLRSPDMHDQSLHGLSFDDIFTANPCSLPSPEPSSLTSEVSKTVRDTGDSNNSCEEFGFDILNSYSLDDLCQLLAESPEQNGPLNSDSVSPGSLLEDKNCSGDHQETSVVIQDSENDLFDVLGLNFKDPFSSHGHVSEKRSEFGQAPLARPPKGLFSELGIAELISSSFSNPSSSITDQTHSEDFCLNPTKRRKLDTSSAQSSSFFAQSCNVMSQKMMRSSEKTSFCNPLNKSETSVKTQPGLWVDDRYSCNFGWNSSTGSSKKAEEGVKKKRAKAGESGRPRPKDRQMIQDRIKELRGMIPNGAKCSIDALLDLTIKHMLFMQSIAKYADKLKQPYEPKKGSSVEEQLAGDRNGATWAFEVGDESVVCPIIVEDLNRPGQMLIEMLCEEEGRFLEIADAVKGFGLNVLKGVMERRDGRIWAHFIVEAKGEVTRLQVFWSLVQLLQQDKGSITVPDPALNLSHASESVSVPLSFVGSLQ